MWNSLEALLSADFMPHGHCYLWSPAMVWAQVASNTLIGVAYACIASTLVLLVRRIKNMPFAWVYIAFGIFILSCGLTHFTDVITVWRPIYWADAGVRIVTAVASVVTAVLILPMVPRAVALAETARLSDERKLQLGAALRELEAAHLALAREEEAARRRAETSEEQLRALVETMPQLTWVTDRDGKSAYRNARWADYTGLSLAELDQHGWRPIHDPALFDAVDARFQEALATGQPFECECRLRDKQGKYRWFLARALPLRAKNGDIQAWMGTCTDIDAQHRLREEALQNAQMKDEFLATVSHELRTPLNSMLGWSRMLRMTDMSPEKRAKALETIERNAVIQAQLIDDLLDVSRIISGKMKLEVALLMPAAPLEAALDVVRPSASARGVNLDISLDREAGPILADAARMQQIVWNLLENAVKFTPKGGGVSVQLGRRDSEVEIRVVDTGIGIESSFLPHVFERFTQADGSTRRKRGGLGLGLAIVKHLVELHGGSIRVESAGLDQGAAFIVSLPVATPPQRLASDFAPQLGSASLQTGFELPPEVRGLNVLLVEDDADSRDMLVALLTDGGVRVLEAATAEAALGILAHTQVDIILSDIGLPGRDGYEFMRAVRTMPGFAQVPAAALTAYAGIQDRQKALDSGFQMHVSKPIEPAQFVTVIVNLARLRTSILP